MNTIPSLTTIEGMQALHKILTENPTTRYVLIGVTTDAGLLNRKIYELSCFITESPSLEKMLGKMKGAKVEAIYDILPEHFEGYQNLRHSYELRTMIESLHSLYEDQVSRTLTIRVSDLTKIMHKLTKPEDEIAQKVAALQLDESEHNRIMFGPSTAEERNAYIIKLLSKRREIDVEHVKQEGGNGIQVPVPPAQRTEAKTPAFVILKK
nr:hypothetical protein K-LCC10_0446 [Kaumoebavirus]